uniref:RNA-directed RNA polymerase n=2 Tax=Riboviria TaxID=2559587 RepID=A0A8F4X5L9_9VIRU|nr:RNA-dependent RNA polymerase [Rhizoctonia solani dsRNA virus 14]
MSNGVGIGANYYDKELPLNYSAPGVGNVRRRFAVCIPPLGGKSTIVRLYNKHLQHYRPFARKNKKTKKNPPDVKGLHEAGRVNPLVGGPERERFTDRSIYHWFIENNIQIKDVDDLYEWERIREYVEARDWEKSQALKSEMLRENATDNTLYLVHGPEDAAALGAVVIAFAIPELSLVSEEDKTKHPERFEFFNMNKRNWRANKVLHDEFQYSKRDDLIYHIAGRLIPHIMWDPTLRGAGFTDDDRTKFHQDRLKKGQREVQDRLAFLNSHSANQKLLFDALNIGIDVRNPHLLAAALRAIWPECDRSIMLRSRAQPKFTAELILRLADAKAPVLRRFIDVVEQSGVSEGVRGCSIVAFTSIMLYYFANEFRGNVMDKLIRAGVFAMGMKGADGILKPMHEDIRRAAAIPPWLSDCGKGDYTDLMYMTTLMGRYYDVTKADDGSIDNRTKFPGVHVASTDGDKFDYDTHIVTMDLVLDKLRHHAKEAILEKQSKTVKDFHADFLTQASSGSAASGKEELSHVESDARMNKRAWLNELTTGDILGLVNREPKVVGQAVNKLELNKIRQLLPGPVWHWLGETVVLWGVERSAYRRDDYIALEKPATVRFQRLHDRLHRAGKHPGRPTLDMDYADFNITHMISDMQKIYRTIRDAALEVSTPGQTWGDTDYAGFVARCCSWLIECLTDLNMRADGGDGHIHHLIRGLWSGWKSTQFINTLENSNYFNQARICLTDILGYDPVIKAEGQGDDMDAVMNDLTDAMITVLYFQRCGHEMQPLKQLIGPYSSEFLRITAHDGQLYGNLSRTIGSFCSSDMQSPELENGPVAVQGMNMAVNTMIRRGLDQEIGEIVREVGIRRFSEIRIFNPANHEHSYYWLEPAEAAISGHDGGLNCGPFGTICPIRSSDPVKDATNLTGVHDLGIVQTGAEWSGAPHIVTKYKGITTHGAPEGTHNHGIAALKTVVSEFLHKRNLHTGVSEEVERAATDATWTGLRDSSAERQIRDDYKKGVADYYSQCRHMVNTKPMVDAVLSDEQKIIALETMEYALRGIEAETREDLERSQNNDEDSDENRALNEYDVEDIISTALRIALGPASISAGIIKGLKDHTGEKLGVWAALAALDSSPATKVLSALNKFHLPKVIEYILNTDSHSLMDTGGIVASELNIVIQMVQLAVANNSAMTSSITHLSYGDWYRLMRATNTFIIDTYKSKYYYKYRL